MQPVNVIKDERFLLHLEKMPHIESSRRLNAAYAMLESETLAGRWSFVTPQMASPDELALVHTREHIEQIAQSRGKPLTSFDLDTQATEKSYDTARLAAGAVCCLLDNIWTGKATRGFAFIRPPGHHAEPDKAMGFCLFNNIALGARYLEKNYAVKKIMIVDIDAHHGNGTQRAFYETDAVLFVSLHQFPGYPGTGNFGEVGRSQGEGFTVNVPLGKGTGDREVSCIIHFLLNPLAALYRPEIILVSCGFDFYLYDRLCGMRVTPEGYGIITRLLLNTAEKYCKGRIAFIMEGGYSLRGIKECGLRVMQELCGVDTLKPKKIEKVIKTDPSRITVLKKISEIHRQYWGKLC